MKAYKYVLFAGILALNLNAHASSDLDKLLSCHEALVDKADARTQKLSDQATPFALVAGKKVFFYTNASAAVLHSGFAGREIVVHLQQNDRPFFRVLKFKDNGEFASVSLQEPTQEQKQKSVEAKDLLDQTSLDILKRELIRQIGTVHAEYQNKYNPQGTIDALNVCKKIPSPELHKIADHQIAYFEKIAKKKPAKKSYDSEKTGQH